MSTKPPLDPLGVSLENLVKVSLNSSHLFDVLQKVFDAVNANAAELNALKNEMMLKTSMTSLTVSLVPLVLISLSTTHLLTVHYFILSSSSPGPTPCHCGSCAPIDRKQSPNAVIYRLIGAARLFF